MKMTSESLNYIVRRRMIKPELFTAAAIGNEEMELLFEAANWAPTHGFTEPWRFVEVPKEAREEFVDTLQIQTLTHVTQHSMTQLHFLQVILEVSSEILFRVQLIIILHLVLHHLTVSM